MFEVLILLQNLFAFNVVNSVSESVDILNVLQSDIIFYPNTVVFVEISTARSREKDLEALNRT